MNRTASAGRFRLLYLLWLLVCAILFVALRGADDPSRRADRLDDDFASEIALRTLQRKSPLYSNFRVVNTAMARSKEVGRPARWIVLLDRWPRTGLRDAVVVELDAKSGELLKIRKAWPSHMSLEPQP